MTRTGSHQIVLSSIKIFNLPPVARTLLKKEKLRKTERQKDRQREDRQTDRQTDRQIAWVNKAADKFQSQPL